MCWLSLGEKKTNHQNQNTNLRVHTMSRASRASLIACSKPILVFFALNIKRNSYVGDYLVNKAQNSLATNLWPIGEPLAILALKRTPSPPKWVENEFCLLCHRHQHKKDSFSLYPEVIPFLTLTGLLGSAETGLRKWSKLGSPQPSPNSDITLH